MPWLLLRSALLAVAVVALGVRPALAQTPVPPRLLEDPGAEYPKSALEHGLGERVEVMLILDVSVDGAVTHARIENPRGDEFDQAALSAAGGLRFAPAMRGQTPIAARIRFQYVFDPPPAAEVPPSAPEAPEAAPSDVPPPTADPLETLEAVDVTVQGDKSDPATKSFSRGEVRRMPGAFGDPFRAIEALPGVTPMASGLPFFYVRGAPPGNVGYFLDGVRVPFLYHVGFGPSVVHPGLVERVDLHTGGYPARFGRFAGGIVVAELTEPQAELHGEANLRLFDAGALVETGFDDGRGSVLLGGRYSYTATILSLVAPEVTLAYHDYQARISYFVTPKDRISVLSFGSYDLLGEDQNGALKVLFGSEFYRLDVRHDHFFASGTVRTAVTLGWDQTKNEFLAGEQRNAQVRSIGARNSVRHNLSTTVQLRAGGDVMVESFGVSEARYADPDNPESRAFERQFFAREDLAIGAFGDLVVQATPDIEVVPGLRADLYRSGNVTATALEPRVAARFTVSDAVRIIHAYGLVHQPPAFALPVPGLTPGNLRSGLQQSAQTSAGVEVDVGQHVSTGATLYYNALFDVSDALGTTEGGNPTTAGEDRALGSAMGAEVFVRRPLTRRLGGFFSYTLSRSTRSLRREKFLSAYDRTHVVNAAVSYGLGRGWQPGARGVFYSGVPKERDTSDGTLLPPRTTDVERQAPFFRLDLRLEKRWLLGQGRWIAFVAEVLNATLAKETFGNDEIGPVTIPSLGVEAKF